MYKNDIIVIIEKDGKPLREVHGNQVFLPFNSEYTIKIKNDSWRKAIASIKIDGTDILGGQELILPPRQTTKVERFLSDGNMQSGSKLKFVPVTDSKVADPSSAENGQIEIEVWFEKPVWKKPFHPFLSDYTQSVYDDGHSNMSYRCADVSQDSHTLSAKSAGDVMTVSCMMMSSPAPTAGATVEGSHSSQTFSYGSFVEKDYPSITFRLYLKPATAQVYTDTDVHCTQCGVKVRYNDRFCSRCGNPVRID